MCYREPDLDIDCSGRLVDTRVSATFKSCHAGATGCLLASDLLRAAGTCSASILSEDRTRSQVCDSPESLQLFHSVGERSIHHHTNIGIEAGPYDGFDTPVC
jgi:hypothetical protein